MKIKEQIANFFTLMNLVCGVTAIMIMVRGTMDMYEVSFFLVFLGAVFDFLDGFVARALKISSEIGKQLDSLSDVITFGVLPGIIASILLARTWEGNTGPTSIVFWLPLLIPTFSAIRLAKFNIDTRQTKDFLGLPTPANALLWASFGIASLKSTFLFGATSISQLSFLLLNPLFLMGCILLTSVLMIAPIRLLGMKFDKFQWKGNELRFLLIATAIITLFVFHFAAVPIILLLYILFSIIHFYILKRHEIQS